jgi:3-hydroxyisobutyrate dehydrogenase
MTQTQGPVAVVGIGAMGHGRATSALRAGIPTIVWNRTPEAIRDLAALGAGLADTVAEAAGRAAIVVTMVTDADAITIARDQGMLQALAPGTIWAQMSTIGVRGIERVVALVKKEPPDITLLDAPVSGSKEPAEHGQLTIFASGPDEAREAVTPLFDALGQHRIWVGPVGSGTRLKLVNNTWLAFAAEAVAASVALARRVGSTRTRSSTPWPRVPSCPTGRQPSCKRSSRATSPPSSHCPSPSRTCTSPSRRPKEAGSPRSRAWPRNGSSS